VEVGGCAAFSEAEGCALGDHRALRVHLAEADAHPTFDGAIATRVASEEAGELFEVTIPPDRTEVLVRATPRGGPAEATIRIHAASRSPRLREIERLRTRGDLAAAEALASEAAREGDPHEKNLAEGALARIALRRGQNEEAARRLAITAESALTHGWLSDAVDDTFARVYVLHQRERRYGEARAALEALEARLGPYADGRAKLPLYRGQLLLETGDLRGALRDFRAAEAGATRLGHTRDRRAARQLLAQALAKTGRAEEGLALASAVRAELAAADDATPCERVEIAMGAAYVALRSGGAAGLERARAELAFPATTLTGCADAYLISLAHLHHARILVRTGDAAAARDALARFRAARQEPRLTDTLEALDVDGRIATLEGDPRAALAAYRTMKDLSTRAHRIEHRWRGALGAGGALATLGQEGAAIATYREAEGALDDAAAGLDLSDGSADFLRDTAESARLLARALAASGKGGEAELVVRRARARSLALVAALAEERARTPEADQALEGIRKMRDVIDEEVGRDWRRSTSERDAAALERRTKLEDAIHRLEEAARRAPSRIPTVTTALAPAPGTVSLTLLREGDGALLAFATSGDRTVTSRARPTTPPDEAALAHALLGPIDAMLKAATRLRVLLPRDGEDLDVHALPFHGAPLVAALEVVYAEDLGPARPWATGPALVVANPSDDLPSARTEGEIAVFGLGRGGAPVISLFGRDATATRVRSALEQAASFHYAGHARFAGPAGLASDLPLASGTTLTFADVLALRRVPRDVVLSGCDAGRGELGPARAWLVAGSEVVVAPSRAVTDAAAEAFARGLHRPLNEGLVRAARLATLESMSRGDAEWRAFRTYVR